MQVRTAQIRIIADTDDEARAAIAALQAAVGTSRISFASPRQGRDKRGDGKPPSLAYGTLQFQMETPAERAAYTGATTRLQATPHPQVTRWTKAAVQRLLDELHVNFSTAVERNGRKGYTQRGGKTAGLLGFVDCGTTWRDVARALGAVS